MTFPWDELNVIRSRVEAQEISETAEDGGKKYDAEKCIDIVYEYLEMAWTMGVDNVNENLSTSFVPQDAEMRSAIYQKVANKDFTERIREWSEKGDFEAIMRVADTDAHRVLNESAFNTAKKAGARFKTWITMEDDKVRDTHAYLHGMTIPIDDYFVTYDGDKALKPGLFTKAENNVNCRCRLEFT